MSAKREPIDLPASRRETAFLATALASVCRDPHASPAALVEAADRCRAAAGRLRGDAAVTTHLRPELLP